MSRRSFIFCDLCNVMATRAIEMRRGGHGRDSRDGRRVSDGRAWFDGSDEQAQQRDWLIAGDHHVCPLCVARVAHMPPAQVARLDLPAALLAQLSPDAGTLPA